MLPASLAEGGATHAQGFGRCGRGPHRARRVAREPGSRTSVSGTSMGRPRGVPPAGVARYAATTAVRSDLPTLSGRFPAERSDVSRPAGPGLPPDAIGDRHRAASQMRRCPAAAPVRPAVCWDERWVGMKRSSLMATGTTSGLASGLSRYPASREGVGSSSSDTSRWLPIRRRRRPPSPPTDVPSAPPGT